MRADRNIALILPIVWLPASSGHQCGVHDDGTTVQTSTQYVA